MKKIKILNAIFIPFDLTVAVTAKQFNKISLKDIIKKYADKEKTG